MKKEKHSGMIDNRKVNDNHQQGIERVKQKSGSMPVGQPGKMGRGDKANWKRADSAMTPRKA